MSSPDTERECETTLARHPEKNISQSDKKMKKTMPHPAKRKLSSLAIARRISYFKGAADSEGRIMSQVISANTLASGLVVFYGAGGSWVEDIARANIYQDKAGAEAGLVAAKLDEAQARVVDVFLVDLKDGAEGRSALTLRDAIRAYGPTIDYLPASPPSAA
jgi:hypothetical protein